MLNQIKPQRCLQVHTQLNNTLNCFMQSLESTQQQTKPVLYLLNKAWKKSDKSRRAWACPDKGGRSGPSAMEMQFSGPELICSSFKPLGLGDHRARKSIKGHFFCIDPTSSGRLVGAAVFYGASWRFPFFLNVKVKVKCIVHMKNINNTWNINIIYNIKH